MNIYTPQTYIYEKAYIVDILIGEFLGLYYNFIPREGIENYEIVLENGNRLIIKDGFFKNFTGALNYLEKKNIPQKIEFTTNQFLAEKDVPIIYGNDELAICRDKIICSIDIFASSFLMLTRWEEYVNKIRDKHNRFPVSESLAYKNGFLNRPVVNEYVEMFWNMLVKLGVEQKRKERKFELFLTHDVDSLRRYRNFISGSKEIYEDFMKRANPMLGLRNLKDKILVHAGMKKDPFDTFDFFMNISENAGVKSNFFLIGKGASKYDNGYSMNNGFLNNVIRKIKARGHNIGLHATYNAYNDSAQLAKEKKGIENFIGMPVKFGRQHYLRFEAPVTWQVWEDNGMEWDSTLCYAEKEGFRCGTCYDYSVFNFLTRKKLALKEKPLIVMDNSFIAYQAEVTPNGMSIKLQALINKCRKYNGCFVLLWHNSSFNTRRWRPFQSVYEDIVIYNI